MRPVIGGIENLDKRSVLFLDFTQAGRLLKLGIGQTKLNFELGLNGLITNDKFCITRWGSIALAPDYRRRRP